MNFKHRAAVVVGCASLFLVAGRHDGAIGQEAGIDLIGQDVSLDCDPTLSEKCARKRLQEGRRLFDVETFGGNGRTCRTCHSKQTGTFTPEEAILRLALDPSDPLFLHDGLDDGVDGTSRITEHATVRIEIPLPPGVVLLDDPDPQERDPQPWNADDDEHAGAGSAADVRHPRAGFAATGVQRHRGSCATHPAAHRRSSWNSSRSSSRRMRASSPRRR